MATNAKKMEQEEMALARPVSSAVALLADEIIADSGAGFEELGSDDIAVPYVSILQKQSKLFDKPGFQGRAGQFVHTLTKELYDGQKGIDVIPCHFRRFWREITKEAQNPKFVAEHPANWPVAKGAQFDSTLRRHICHDGTHANQIMRFFALVVAPCDPPQPVCLTFKGSQIKVAKAWNSMLSVQTMKVPADGGLRSIQAPMYASIWNLSTVLQSNDENSWYGYEVVSRGQLDPMNVEADAKVWVQARDFQRMVAMGNVVELGDEDANE